MIEVILEDDGVGLPEDFDLSRPTSLGLRIARTLAVSDLKGSFDLVPAPGGGARSIIRFPQPAER
jgi:two-component sensor histidine kinase